MTHAQIDIIEGVNDNKVNKYVLHTDTNCKVDGQGMTAAPASLDCALDGANKASGCDVNEVRTNSFGPGFKGGYYVMEWDSEVIQMWFFPRGSTVPRSLTTSSPDTSEFGTPAAKFAGSACDIEKRFKDQRFIFTNNFCGDWAGNTYSQSGCPKQYAADGKTELDSMASCKKYVAENPDAFKDQFWRIGSFKTYKKNAVSSSSSISMSKTTSHATGSTKASSSASSTKTSSSASSIKVSSSASSTKVSSSSAHVSSSASSHAVSSSTSHIVSSSVASSSSAHVTSIASHASSSSVHASVSSSALSSVHSDVHSVSVSSDMHASSSVKSDTHGSSFIAHVSSSTEAYVSSTPVASVSPDVHGSSSTGFISSTYYPTGQTSSAVYPVSSLSSSASVHSYGNFSAPISYSVPAYGGSSSSAPVYGVSSSAPVYGESPKSTPCTTSSAKDATSTLGYPPVYPNSVPVYNDYPSYPVSSPVKNDYPYLPSFTPVSPIYPPATSVASYNDYYQPPVSKTTVTTTYTTTYVDVCETGYVTKTTTFAVTYCPSTTPAVPTPGKPNNPPTYGWDVSTKVCQSGCGEGPKTVTVTIPCTKCDLSKATPTPGVPNKPNTPEKPNTPSNPNKPSCNGYDCKEETPNKPSTPSTPSTPNKPNTPSTPSTPSIPNKPSCNGFDCKDSSTFITSKIYETKIITLTKTPVPETPKSSQPVYSDKPSSKPADAPKVTPVSSKPSEPAKSTPGVSGTPVYGGGKNNGTISVSVGTGVNTPSKTGYNPPVFTGAASGVQVGGVGVVVGVVAAFFL